MWEWIGRPDGPRADLVTAMMALFIVLWIVGQSKALKDAVAGYFRDPSGF